jgi:hypothetical protein
MLLLGEARQLLQMWERTTSRCCPSLSRTATGTPKHFPSWWSSADVNAVTG